MKSKGMIKVLVMTVVLVFLVSACGVTEVLETKSIEPVESAAVTVDPNNPTPGAAGMKIKNPEEIFRFETTALQGEGGKTINPTGMLLNIGCEDCQDIFYASKSLTVEEVIEKIKTDFGVKEMLVDENYVRFDLNLESIRKLEIDLDLIAAKKLEIGNEIVNVRIISIKP